MNYSRIYPLNITSLEEALHDLWDDNEAGMLYDMASGEWWNYNINVIRNMIRYIDDVNSYSQAECLLRDVLNYRWLGDGKWIVFDKYYKIKQFDSSDDVPYALSDVIIEGETA